MKFSNYLNSCCISLFLSISNLAGMNPLTGIDHIGIYAEDIEISHSIYEPLLQTIDIHTIFRTEHCVAYGRGTRPCFELYKGVENRATRGNHICFSASTKSQVDLFYNTALKLGFTGNGAPGYRTYFPGYYAAFVIDPEGNNIECLFWDLPEAKVMSQ